MQFSRRTTRAFPAASVGGALLLQGVSALVQQQGASVGRLRASATHHDSFAAIDVAEGAAEFQKVEPESWHRPPSGTAFFANPRNTAPSRSHWFGRSLLALKSRFDEQGPARLAIEFLLLGFVGISGTYLARRVPAFGKEHGKQLPSPCGCGIEDASDQLRASHAAIRLNVHTLDTAQIEQVTGGGLHKARLAPDAGGAGLDDESVTRLRAIFGDNALTPPDRESPWVLLLYQVFGGLFNIMLWACVACELVLALFFGGDDFVTPVILSMVIVSSGVLQWWTEQQAEGMMTALQQMQVESQVTTYRLRDRQAEEVALPADQLVPGDVVLLEAGSKVPADVRILACTDGTLVENSALTGESVSEARSAGLSPVSQPLMESRNVAFSGTSVVQGKMVCVVFGTGDNTLLGQIATKIRTARTRSSLEIQIEHFVHIIAGVAMVVGILSLVANVLSPRVRSFAEILENAATAFFAQVPEGLLPTVTVCLMIASKKMARQKVLVRKIDAVETLGCIGILCSDKTGTLTSGSMAATDFVVPAAGGGLQTLRLGSDLSPEPTEELARLSCCGALNTAAKDDGQGGHTGSPTEVAIIEGCRTALGRSVEDVRGEHPQIFEIPFNSANKWMLTVHAVAAAEPFSSQGPAETTVFAILKGAPERVLDMCDMDLDSRAEVDAAFEALMRQGKRVLCFAEKRLEHVPPDFEFRGSGPEDANFPLEDFKFRGLVALEDPPKAGVEEAVGSVGKAGVKAVMVTGDHPGTAEAIARRIGLIPANTIDDEVSSSFRVVTGAALDQHVPPNDNFDMDTTSPHLALFWKRCVEHTRVFARVSPMHKRTIVRAYQHYGGHITAMTGDGVNDAPALKEAEVGIAMGIRGTEVAKEAADIVLLDDNLASVVQGIEQGRLCSENLRKSIMYTLCSKVPQALPTLAELFGMPSAITTAQVLLIDIGTDIWTAIAFAWQPPEGDLMEQAPRHPRQDQMVNKGVLLYSYGYIGIVQSLACWAVFLLAMPSMYAIFAQDKHPSEYTAVEVEANYAGMTSYYWTLVLGQVGAAIATTTTRQSIFKTGLPNKWLGTCIVLEILLALVVILWTPLQGLFKTRNLTLAQFAAGFLGFVALSALEELRKAWLRRKPPQ